MRPAPSLEGIARHRFHRLTRLDLECPFRNFLNRLNLLDSKDVV
jgi:hypothetical protein